MYPLFRDSLPTTIFQDLWLRFLFLSGSEPEPTTVKSRGFKKDLSSPIGVSSGLTLDGSGLPNLVKLGLGWVEIGPVAPTSEYFVSEAYKFSEDKLERIGPFTSFGALWVKRKLLKYNEGPRGVDLVPLRENIDSVPHTTDDDFIYSVNKLYGLVDYFSFNLCASRFLPVKYYQKTKRFEKFLENISAQRELEIGLIAARKTGILKREDVEIRNIYTPFYLKVNAEWQDLKGLVETCIRFGIDGLIVGDEGEDIEKSRKILEEVSSFSQGKLEIISYGGIRTGAEVKERLKRGAKLVQIYPILLEKGPSEYSRIKQEYLSCISSS